jgi:hypothetical protein
VALHCAELRALGCQAVGELIQHKAPHEALALFGVAAPPPATAARPFQPTRDAGWRPPPPAAQAAASGSAARGASDLAAANKAAPIPSHPDLLFLAYRMNFAPRAFESAQFALELSLAALRGDVADMTEQLSMFDFDDLKDNGTLDEYRLLGFSSPVHYAAAGGDVECVAALLERGDEAAFGLRTEHEATEESGCEGLRGVNAAHLAALQGHTGALQLLLEHDEQLHASRLFAGRTPLHCAAANGHDDCVSLLLQAGANARALDDDGATALHLAVRRDHVRVAATLLRASCGYAAREQQRRRALAAARELLPEARSGAMVALLARPAEVPPAAQLRDDVPAQLPRCVGCGDAWMLTFWNEGKPLAGWLPHPPGAPSSACLAVCTVCLTMPPATRPHIAFLGSWRVDETGAADEGAEPRAGGNICFVNAKRRLTCYRAEVNARVVTAAGVEAYIVAVDGTPQQPQRLLLRRLGAADGADDAWVARADARPLLTLAYDRDMGGARTQPLMRPFAHVADFLGATPATRGVAVRNPPGALPPPLAAALEARLDALAAAGGAAFHPGSANVVLDLIHPALFCYVDGATHVRPGSFDGGGGGAQPAAPQPRPAPRRLLAHVPDANCAWLPAEVDVDANGHATFASYINGLDASAANAPLYDDIASALSATLPMLEAAMAGAKAPPHWAQGAEQGEDDADGIGTAAPALRARRLQVIVKAAYYVLQPGQRHEGVWHVEGAAHERIVATGIHYLSASPSVSVGALQFRARLTEDDEMEVVESNDHAEPPPFEMRNVALELGAVPTPPGSSLAFHNSLQNKLAPLHCAHDAEAPGVRKMLCFFLIGAFSLQICTCIACPSRRLCVRCACRTPNRP